MTNCTNETGKTKETEDNIKKLMAMTKLEAEQKEEFANLLKQYPKSFTHNDNDSGHTSYKTQDTFKDDIPFKDRVKEYHLACLKKWKLRLKNVEIRCYTSII